MRPMGDSDLIIPSLRLKAVIGMQPMRRQLWSAAAICTGTVSSPVFSWWFCIFHGTVPIQHIGACNISPNANAHTSCQSWALRPAADVTFSTSSLAFNYRSVSVPSSPVAARPWALFSPASVQSIFFYILHSRLQHLKLHWAAVACSVELTLKFKIVVLTVLKMRHNENFHEIGNENFQSRGPNLALGPEFDAYGVNYGGSLWLGGGDEHQQCRGWSEVRLIAVAGCKKLNKTSIDTSFRCL